MIAEITQPTLNLSYPLSHPLPPPTNPQNMHPAPKQLRNIDPFDKNRKWNIHFINIFSFFQPFKCYQSLRSFLYCRKLRIDLFLLRFSLPPASPFSCLLTEFMQPKMMDSQFPTFLKGRGLIQYKNYLDKGGQGQRFSFCYQSPAFSILTQQNYFINSFFNNLNKEGSKKHLNLTLSNIICQMQTQTQFKLTTAHIRQRLLSMIDFHLQDILLQEQTLKQHLIVLNQSLLQEWYELLTKMVYVKEYKKIPTKATKVNSKKSNTNKVLSQIKPIPSLPYSSSKILISADTNHIDLYQVESSKSGAKYAYNSYSTRLQFKSGFIHRFCTYNVVSQGQILFIGGCTENKTLKSADIVSLDLKTNELVKVSELPYGVSSHGAVRIDNKIYIIGGNRDPNMVTKKCLQYDITQRKCNPIDQLHYPSASHCVLSWKNKFIYKFGGVGSCFGEWDLSPYIERYDINGNSWQIVNPIIKINQSLIQHYSLLVNSLAYVTNRQSIVVFGGFDLKQEPSRKMFEMSVRDEEVEGQIQTVHQLINFGELSSLEPGGFLPQQPFCLHDNIFALQTQPHPKSGLQEKLVRISTEVHYL